MIAAIGIALIEWWFTAVFALVLTSEARRDGRVADADVWGVLSGALVLVLAFNLALWGVSE